MVVRVIVQVILQVQHMCRAGASDTEQVQFLQLQVKRCRDESAEVQRWSYSGEEMEVLLC